MDREDETGDGADTRRRGRVPDGSHRGGRALLVAGAVPDGPYERLSQRLLAAESTATSRRLVVSGSDDGTTERLEATGPTAPEYARVVLYGAGRRGAAEGPLRSSTAPDGPKVHYIDPSMGRLGATLTEVIDQFDAAAGGFGPAELRVAVDCLPTLFAEYDREAVFRFLHVATAQVRSREGVAHVRVPRRVRERDVLTYAPLFDAVVELRVDDDELEERWHSVGSSDSGWVPVS